MIEDAISAKHVGYLIREARITAGLRPAAFAAAIGMDTGQRVQAKEAAHYGVSFREDSWPLILAALPELTYADIQEASAKDAAYLHKTQQETARKAREYDIAMEYVAAYCKTTAAKGLVGGVRSLIIQASGRTATNGDTPHDPCLSGGEFRRVGGGRGAGA